MCAIENVKLFRVSRHRSTGDNALPVRCALRARVNPRWNADKRVALIVETIRGEERRGEEEEEEEDAGRIWLSVPRSLISLSFLLNIFLTLVAHASTSSF